MATTGLLECREFELIPPFVADPPNSSQVWAAAAAAPARIAAITRIGPPRHRDDRHSSDAAATSPRAGRREPAPEAAPPQTPNPGLGGFVPLKLAAGTKVVAIDPGRSHSSRARTAM